MFNLTVKRPLTGFVLSSLVVTVWAACSADDSVVTTSGTTSTGTNAGTGGNGGAGTTNTAGTAGSGTGTAGQGGTGSTVSAGGSGGSAGSGGTGGTGGGAGSAGAAGAGGTAGGKDAGGGGAAGSGPSGDGGPMCTPIVATPDPTTGFVRTGWGGQWTPMCNFNTGNGTCATLPPANAFDGKSNRTSLGDTHLATGTTAQMIGDTFTFDMQTCHAVTRIEMYCGNPPNNAGFDARDFPGQVEVSVSSDCTTTAGVISGTFTPFAPPLLADEPLGTNGMPCSRSSCPGPFLITFPAGTAARCVRMRLTRILAAGGGVWWAIGEIYVR